MADAAKPKTKPKSKLLKVLTPVGTASFPKLVKPDTEGPYADGKFKVKVIFDGDADMSKLTAAFLAQARAEWGDKIKPSQFRVMLKDGTDWNANRESEGKTPVDSLNGKFFLEAKSQKRPQTVDTAKKPIPVSKIEGGDRVRIHITLNPCVISGQKTVACWLNLVQLVEKREGADYTGDLDEIEGYTDDGVEDDTVADGDDETDY